MTTAVLCLVAFCLLLWVVLLKLQETGLKEQILGLRTELARLVKLVSGKGEIKTTPREWGAIGSKDKI